MSLSLYFIPFFSLHQDAAEEPVYGSYVELFQGVLGDKKPIFKGNVPDDYLIIDEPHKTLKHDIINADIDGHVGQIKASAQVKPDPRDKKLFAIVTGVGRGKTRTLIEIMKKVNNDYKKTVCLAITFNHHFAVGGDWKHLGLKFRTIYAINVVARIISMSYQLPFVEVEDLLFQGFNSLEKPNKSTPTDLIQSCIRFIVQQYRANHHIIDHFVLLVDESVVIIDRLDPGNTMDIHSTLRDSLLSTSIRFDDDKSLSVDLVMSALNVGPTGVTSSGRTITPLTTSESLDVAEIWSKWVPAYIENNFFFRN